MSSRSKQESSDVSQVVWESVLLFWRRMTSIDMKPLLFGRGGKTWNQGFGPWGISRQKSTKGPREPLGVLRVVLEVLLFLSPLTCIRILTNMCWGISAGSDCVHTIWDWSLANGMVALAFVINVSVEKFKMRSMCFSFASVLKYASCAWDTETSLKECWRLSVCLLLRALNLFLS